MTDKPMSGGLWRDNPETPEGKYLVKRRDGTIPEWPSFVLGGDDPYAPAGLLAYAQAAWAGGADSDYCRAVARLADEWKRRPTHGKGDPDRGRHRIDDPATIAEMKKGKST